jgi:putative SOS response-associated peptidase YedK
MCFYYAILKTDAKVLIANRIITEEQLNLFPEKKMVNGFDYPYMPVIASNKPDEIQMFRWGFVPPHIYSVQKAREFLTHYNTLNAKSESLFESRLYGESIMKRRCLILCSGFFEWRHKDPTKKNPEKYPFYVSLKDEGMFVFGGIWESFTITETGESIKTYAIITTPANPLMELVHNSKKRMPLILGPEDATKWLDNHLNQEEIKSLIKPFDASKLKAIPIRRMNPRINIGEEKGFNIYYHYEELTPLLKQYPEYFEQSVDLRSISPTLF